MLGSQGQIRIPLMSGTLEVLILSIHRLSILSFLQAPFPLPQDLPRGIQLSPQSGPFILHHNQLIQDANHQVPTPLHTHHLPLACLL
uniref:Proline rich 13 n=1 Tax=Molossus molossus TaxID=27622 RepID=A0A7J8G104_MOLMO|nr:proline rich 13 [Molossus molossus]